MHTAAYNGNLQTVGAQTTRGEMRTKTTEGKPLLLQEISWSQRTPCTVR